MRNKIFIPFVFVLYLLSSCRVENIGKDLSSGLNKNMDSIGKNLMAGIKREITDAAFQQNLKNFVDSLVGSAGGSANRSVKNIIDSLTGDQLVLFTRKLIEEATGRQLKANIGAITDDLQLTIKNLLGEDTRARIRLMVASALDEITGGKLQATIAQLRDEMTGPALRRNLISLRDSLLDSKTNTAIKGLVDTAMVTFANRLKTDVNPQLQQNLSFIQKNATSILIVVGIIALVIIIVIWRLKEKYAKMTTVMASQIHDIPDQKAYDALTHNIKEKAIIAGVEPSLKKVLEKNGMLGKESRESWQTKKAAILENKN